MPIQRLEQATKLPSWFRIAALACLTGLVSVALAACHKESAEDVVSTASVLAEQSAQGTLYWDVDRHGDTRLVVKDDKGDVLHHGVTGQLEFTAGSGSPQTVDLKLNEDSGVAHADGPDLKGLTQIKYTLIVNGKAQTGALHLPEAGTEGLVKTAKDNEAKTEVNASHGGTVQVVGDHRYEVAADSETGETRVYPLGDVKVKPKTLKLAVDAEAPRIVELDWHADGYYVARLDVVHPPRAVTLVEVVGDDDVHVALIGFHPGLVVKFGVHPVFWVHREWLVRADWDHPGLARGHYMGDPVRGPPGQTKIMIKDDEHEHGHGGGKSKVMVKVH